MEVVSNRLSVDRQQLTEIMQAFYTVTHIKSTLYDTQFQKIMTYPGGHCDFCRLVRQRYQDRCTQSDRQAFAECARCGATLRYCCHMGLYEVVSPLRHNGQIIGYVMFGQMLQQENRALTIDSMLRSHADLAESATLQASLEKVVSKTQQEISAATLLMEACINYLLFNQIVRIHQGNFVEELDRYISAHISEEITVQSLCQHFGMSRSSFYMLMQKCLGCGIKQHIRTARLKKAKELLGNTGMQITAISEAVGFLDYNYFLRVFKRETGLSCKEYRMSQK